MKWYTLEEKRVEVGDHGLFALKIGHFEIADCVKVRGKKRLRSNFSHEYTLDDFWYWIPNEELMNTLPNLERLKAYCVELDKRHEKTLQKMNPHLPKLPEYEKPCGTCDGCLEEDKLWERMDELTCIKLADTLE